MLGQKIVMQFFALLKMSTGILIKFKGTLKYLYAMQGSMAES